MSGAGHDGQERIGEVVGRDGIGRVGLPDLPAAAHGAIQQDQVQGDVAFRLGGRVLLRHAEVGRGENLVGEAAGVGRARRQVTELELVAEIAG